MKRRRLKITHIFNFATLVFLGVFMMVGFDMQSAFAAENAQALEIDKLTVFQEDDDTLKIGFVVHNTTNHTQVDINYKISLERVVVEGNLISGSEVDSYVVNDKKTISPQQSLTEEISYKLPVNYASGKYRVVVYINSSSGLVLGFKASPIFELEQAQDQVNNNIFIDQRSCELHYNTEEEQVDRVWSLLDGVDIKPDEEIIVLCKVVNNSESDEELQQMYSTFDRGGKSIKQDYGKSENIKQGEQWIAFVIPNPKRPQSYDTKIGLADKEGVLKTNVIKVHYVVSGDSATIQQVDFDDSKFFDNHQVGVTVQITGRADMFAGSRFLTEKNNDVSDANLSHRYKVTVQILGSGDKICGKVDGYVDTLKEDRFESRMKIDKGCEQGKLLVKLFDENNVQLDSFEIPFTIGSAVGKNGDNQSENMGTHLGDRLSYYILLGLVALTIIGVLIIVVKRRKRGLSLFLLGVIFSGFYGVATAQAVRLQVPSFNVPGWSKLDHHLDITPSCPQIDFTAQVRGCANTSQNEMGIWYDTIKIKTAYSHCNKWVKNHKYKTQASCPRIKDWKWEGNACWHYAPSACDVKDKTNDITTFSYRNPNQKPGTHRVNISAQFEPGDKRFRVNHRTLDKVSRLVSYRCPSPVNARCNSRINGKELNARPTKGLCTKGAVSGRVTGDGSKGNPWRWTCNGVNGGKDATCSATQRPINAVCNSDLNGKKLDARPTANLCTKGTPGTVTGNGSKDNPWTWTCNGINGGKDATCSALLKEPDCGSVNGTKRAAVPTTNLCSSGTASDVAWDATNSKWTWTCTAGNKTKTCQAPRGCADPNSLICNNTCMPPVTFSSQVNLHRGGGADPAKITIPQGIYCDLDQNGVREATNDTYEIPVTSHPFELEKQCGCNGGRNPVVECVGNKMPNGEACVSEPPRTIGGTIQCVCTAKKCSTAGTCVSTPVFASSYSDSQCASSCSSNADCSSGSIRETN